MAEVIEQADDVAPAGVVGIGGDDLLQELNLVFGGLAVVGGRLDDLERNMSIKPVSAIGSALRDLSSPRTLYPSRARPGQISQVVTRKGVSSTYG
jgi:hypothetical protein